MSEPSETTEEAVAPPAPAEEPATFSKNDLVWIKFFGFPWWPGRVSENSRCLANATCARV